MLGSGKDREVLGFSGSFLHQFSPPHLKPTAPLCEEQNQGPPFLLWFSIVLPLFFEGGGTQTTHPKVALNLPHLHHPAPNFKSSFYHLSSKQGGVVIWDIFRNVGEN